MKSPKPPARVEIGLANCPNPEQVLIPPKWGDKAKAFRSVKWHLLKAKREEGIFIPESPLICVVQAAAVPGPPFLVLTPVQVSGNPPRRHRYSRPPSNPTVWWGLINKPFQDTMRRTGSTRPMRRSAPHYKEQREDLGRKSHVSPPLFLHCVR